MIVSLMVRVAWVNGLLTLSVLDNLGNLALHDGDGGVGGTEIDTDHGAGDLAIRGC